MVGEESQNLPGCPMWTGFWGSSTSFFLSPRAADADIQEERWPEGVGTLLPSLREGCLQTSPPNLLATAME